MALLSGMESNERVSLLFKLTKLSSDDVKAAIYHHLCDGVNADNAAVLHNITAGQLSRAMTKLNNVNDIVVKIEECDFSRFIKNG